LLSAAVRRWRGVFIANDLGYVNTFLDIFYALFWQGARTLQDFYSPWWLTLTKHGALRHRWEGAKPPCVVVATKKNMVCGFGSG